MKLTDEQIEQMALEAYPKKMAVSMHDVDVNYLLRITYKEAIKQARKIYEKEIQRLKLEILTMTGTIDDLRDELKRLKG